MDTDLPLISVVLPVYNVEAYLEECLESLINQEYKVFELIAVNDGSTDNSLKILEDYKDKFENMLIISQENRGLSEARNTGMKYIKGKYTYFLDSDDFIIPSTFLNLVKKAEENQLDLIKFDAKPFSTIDIKFSERKYDTSDILSEEIIYSRDMYVNRVKKKFMPPVWLYFIKTSVITDNDLSFEKDILHEDELFTVQLLNYCNRVMYDSSKYFQRRYRENSIMTSNINKNVKAYSSKIKVISILNNFIINSKSQEYTAFVKDRKNVLYTTLLFNSNFKIKEGLLLSRRFNLFIDIKTLLRELKSKLAS